jgi:hypothetical protein
MCLLWIFKICRETTTIFGFITRCYDKMSNIFTPFVYWAQTENQITLKVDLTDVKVWCDM